MEPSYEVVSGGEGVGHSYDVISPTMKEDHRIKFPKKTMYWTTLISDYEYDTIQILIYRQLYFICLFYLYSSQTTYIGMLVKYIR